MTEDEYAIVSKKEFMALKKELERIKKNPLEGSESGEDLQASIDNLNKSLNVMLEVFKQAAESMKLEEHDADTVAKQIGPLNEKIESLADQNQKIAKGIVAIADMVKEKLDEISRKEEHRLPPLSGGPAPKAPMPAPAPAPAPAPSFGAPPPLGGPGFAPPSPGAPGGLPPLDAPEGMGPAPGAPPAPSAPLEGKKDIMGGLMK